MIKFCHSITGQHAADMADIFGEEHWKTFVNLGCNWYVESFVLLFMLRRVFAAVDDIFLSFPMARVFFSEEQLALYNKHLVTNVQFGIPPCTFTPSSFFFGFTQIIVIPGCIWSL